MKNKNKITTIVIIVVAVLLILAVAAGTFFFVNRALNGGEDPSSAPTLADLSSDVSSAPASSEFVNQLPVATSSTLPDGVYFFEDFRNRLKQADGWNKDASVSGQRYAGAGVVLTGFSNVSTLKDYAVEAEISVNMIGASNVNLNVAAILGRYITNDKGEGGGFEVGLATETKTGHNYVRVYDRLGKKTVAQFECLPLEVNKAYKLTAVFSGKNLLVFIDGVCIGKTTVENRAGTVGINRGGYTAYFDNFTVRKATSAEKSAKPTTQPSANGTSSAAGNTLPEGVYFLEDFEDKVKTTDGWNIDADASNGQYLAAKSLILTRNTTISGMKNYVVESEIFIDANKTYKEGSLPGTNVAAIIGRYAQVGDAAGGFEVGIAIQTADKKSYLRVYDRAGKKHVAEFKDVALYGNQYYTLTALFYNSTLAIFLDGTYVGKVTVENRAGTVGLSRNGYDTYFDNFTVRKPTDSELSAAGLK